MSMGAPGEKIIQLSDTAQVSVDTTLQALEDIAGWTSDQLMAAQAEVDSWGIRWDAARNAVKSFSKATAIEPRAFYP
jgi:hypothetical protein